MRSDEGTYPAHRVNGSRWERLAEAFEAVAARDPGERQAILDELLGATGTTRDEVASMLKASDDRATLSIERKLLAAAAAAAESAGSASLVAGLRIGPWRVDALERAGGMGEVYRASRVDGAFEQRVAIKVVRRANAAVADDRRRRFEGERRILAHLEHPEIVGIIDGGWLDDGRPYFVMPFIEGRPLLAHCDAEALSMHDRIALLTRVARAVGHAHARGVVHRDLKPSNILVGTDGRPRLLDFGIAKFEGDLLAAETCTGAMLLTPAYAAPEQLRGGTVTPATDVYALGVLLRELMVGRASPSCDLTTEVQGIARRSLADDPAERFPDAGALATELERALRRHSSEAGAGRDGPSAEHRSWTRRLLAFGAAATGSVAVIGLISTAAIVISHLAGGDGDEVSLGEVSSAEAMPAARDDARSVAKPAAPTGAADAPPADARIAAAGESGAAPAPPTDAARSAKATSPSAQVPPASSGGPDAAGSAGDSAGAAERRRPAGRIDARRAATRDASDPDELRKLAGIYGVRGLTVPALALMDSVVERVSAREGPTSVGAAYARAQRSVLQLQRGALDAAGRDLAFADSVFRSARPRPDSLIADSDLFGGALALLRGHPDSALARFEASYAARVRTRGAHPKRAAAACGMGLALESLGRVDDAAPWQPFCSMQQRWPRGFYRPMVELLRDGASRAGSLRRD